MSHAVPLNRAGHEAAESELESAAAGSHVVHFFEEQPFLFDTVARFLGAGLEAGDALVIIATPEHAAGFLARLDDSRVQLAVAEGRLHRFDARETLAQFMVKGSPDRDTFHRLFDEILSRATNGRSGARVRAYGEMVDLLWRDGLESAAVELEELWNETCSRHSLSLLCAYAMANFYKRVNRLELDDVRRLHDHVVPGESAKDPEELGSSSEVERLRERVRSLEGENEQLRAFDRARRGSASERLQERDERFRLLVESVKDYAIFILDPNGVVVTWNAGAERIKGYKAAEIIGKHFSMFYLREEVASGKCEMELAAALAEGRFEDEGWRLRRDGSRFWANVVITPLRDPSGTAVGFAKVTRDLTERVRAESERVQLARIEEAQRRKDEFLAIMGHELRNPLAPLVTAAHMIRLRGGRATEKEMGILDRQLRQMTTIVSDLLDASHAMRDKVELSLQVLEIGAVLADAVDLASPLIEARHHELVIEVPGRGLLVNVDTSRMAQVFGNVLNNAAKYTPPGGTIRVRATRRGDQVEVVIEDNGQGIAPRMRDQIFDLFTQGDHGLERDGGGLGIGLAIARNLVKEHHGEILAESDGVGRGSRFTIRLPRALVQPRAVATTPKTATASRRILIADDNRDSVELMQELLKHSGHDVRVAFDGPATLEVCRQFKPDTVFLDIGLPGLDGYEVAKRIRAIPSCERIQIVAITGYAREEDRARALESGFTDHVAKPIDLDRFSKLLAAPNG
jgi:PAS domain S-box-containing protein